MKEILIWNQAGQTEEQLYIEAEVRPLFCSRKPYCLEFRLLMRLKEETERSSSCAFVVELLNKVWRVSRKGEEAFDLVRSSKLEVWRSRRLSCFGNRWRRSADELRQCGTAAWLTASVVSPAEGKCPSARGELSLRAWTSDIISLMTPRTSGKNVVNLRSSNS